MQFFVQRRKTPTLNEFRKNEEFVVIARGVRVVWLEVRLGESTAVG